MKKVKNLQKNIAIFLLFIIVTAVFTYPFIFKIGSSIPGFENTDEPYWSLWYFWWLKYSILHKLNMQFCPLMAAPFGVDFGRLLYPVWDFVCSYLGMVFGELIIYNLQIIASLLLSAIFMYLLVENLTASRLAAFFSGMVYSFCPYHMVRIWQHFNLIQIEWLVLLVFGLCKVREKNNLKNAVFLGLAFSIIAFFSIYYSYFAVIILASFFVFTFIFDKMERWKILKPILMAILVACVVLLPIFLPLFASFHALPQSGEWGYARPFENLFSQSARPLSYLLPSVNHPLLGKFTENFVGTSLYGLSLTEHVLYLGWAPLILAFIAFRNWRKKIKLRTTDYGLRTDEGFYIGFFIFLAVVAWLFSQPPWWQIGPLRVYMPSFFMYKLLPMFRAYARFGIVVMLAVAVLAGFGVKFILAQFRSQKSKLAVTALCCGLVLFEFWNWPPYKVIDVSKAPAVYYWLKEQPGDFVIAEYPLDAVAPDQMYRFYQITHQKKIINDTVPGTPANDLAKNLTRLSEPRTAGVLKWMGVRYAIVHRDRYLNTGLVKDKEEFAKIPQNKGLRLIKTFPAQQCPEKNIMCVRKTGPIDLYEVTADLIIPEVR